MPEGKKHRQQVQKKVGVGMDINQTLYVHTREAWRSWLQDHYATASEVWLRYPKVTSGLPRLRYNDAVEEALCFGWIDSTMRSVDDQNNAQRFTPRRPGSPYSRANIERLRKLVSEHKVLPEISAQVAEVFAHPFDFPPDILAAVQANPEAWRHYQAFSPAYQRIRVAYINGARNRPEEFARRLKSFIKATAENKQLGFGGIEDYY